MTSSITSSSSSCRLFPVALVSSSSSPPPLQRPSPPRVRRPRRVLYPASRCRRPPPSEAPDPARRWLLLLSALVFLQIYTEEALTCTDPDSADSQEVEDGLDMAQAWATGEEPCRLQMVGGASEVECAVA